MVLMALVLRTSSRRTLVPIFGVASQNVHAGNILKMGSKVNVQKNHAWKARYSKTGGLVQGLFTQAREEESPKKLILDQGVFVS